MVDIISKIIPELNKRLISKRIKEHISYLIEKRFTNEKMLQLEILNIISNMPEVKDYMPEMPYNYNNAIKCDIWFSLQDGEEYWIEVKMRPTNYHKKEHHGKAIKKGIDGIIKDVNRLKKAKGNKFMIFAFYPIYQESDKYFTSIITSLPSLSTHKKSGLLELYINSSLITLKSGSNSFKCCSIISCNSVSEPGLYLFKFII